MTKQMQYEHQPHIRMKKKAFYLANRDAILTRVKERLWYKIKNENGTPFIYSDYLEHFELQGGLCLICHRAQPGKALAVDHCHSSMRFRGLLCGQCNQGLGYFRDDPEALLRARDYLKGI